MKKRPKKVELSIIILCYNNEKEIVECLDSVYKYNGPKISGSLWELLVVDNASVDETVKVVRKKYYPKIKIIRNRKNIGFARANNVAAKLSRGQSVLFLNPDTLLEEKSIVFPLEYLKSHSDVGAVTAKLVLGNGQLDATCHRGFPTPWNAFCYFSGLTKIFPKSKLFAGYILGHLDLEATHEVDAINGAYFMIPAHLGQKLGWFDEEFFWKGEDLDFSFRINELGFKIMYLPQVTVWHFKGSSQGHLPGSNTLDARFDVMQLFYDKHYQDKYPSYIRLLVRLGISLRKFLVYFGI